jgi:hypothetical protein
MTLRRGGDRSDDQPIRRRISDREFGESPQPLARLASSALPNKV